MAPLVGYKYPPPSGGGSPPGGWDGPMDRRGLREVNATGSTPRNEGTFGTGRPSHPVPRPAPLVGEGLSFTFSPPGRSRKAPAPRKFVFQDVNIQTHPDELVAIVGPTGTGKSTLLRCLGRFLAPATGRVLLQGKEITRPSSRIALIHQSIATFPWMTALENVKLALKCKDISEGESETIARRMLRLVGLQEMAQHYPKEMSGGMRQKIAIARALAAEPAVLLMDEPFVHLDELTAAALRREIYSLVFNPATTLQSVVLVSHNLHEVVELADRVLVMVGSPARIVEEVRITMPHPRSYRDPPFYEYLDHLTGRLEQPSPEVLKA